MKSIPDTRVRDAYERCRRMQRRHDPTYYLATRRLPRDVRPAVHALYGFLRGADEIVDGPARPPEPDVRRAALDAWHQALEEGIDAGRSEHPVIAALVDAGQRHDLALGELSVYIDSMRVDCAPRVRIASREELDRYMNGSAATVGRVITPLLGVPRARREEVARLGVAFQLTNFIRDVREDWTMDRVYLPGLDERALAAGEATPPMRAAVEQEVARARELFAVARDVVPAARPEVRAGIRLATAFYSRVLSRVERRGFAVT